MIGMGERLSIDSTLDRKRRRRVAAVGSFLVLLVVLLSWQAVSALGMVHAIILPPPMDVAQALFETLTEGFFYEHLQVTVVEVLAGFVIGSAIGLSLGAFLGSSRMARLIAYPYVIAFQGLPKVVLAPIFIAAFGFGISSKIVMAVAISFFPLLIDTMAGFASVDPEAVRLMKSLKASRRDVILKLAIPHALPHIFAGLKTGVTLALVGALVGEFVGASEGLGYLLSVYTYQLQISRVYAVTLVLAGLGVVLFMMLDFIDRRIVFWASERQLESSM